MHLAVCSHTRGPAGPGRGVLGPGTTPPLGLGGHAGAQAAMTHSENGAARSPVPLVAFPLPTSGSCAEDPGNRGRGSQSCLGQPQPP